MDFSQRHKINSGYGLPNRQQFMQQATPKSQQFINQMPSKLSHQIRNMTQSCYHPPQQPPATSYQVPRQFYGRGVRTAMPTGNRLETMYEVDENFTVPSNSYCSETYVGKHQFAPKSHESSMSDEELEVEYFQCKPTPSITSKQANPFKEVIKSMRQYSMSKLKQKPAPKPETNHRMIVVAHEEADDEEEILDLDGRRYQTQTKIETIPRGVRIITDIVKEDDTEHRSSLVACHSTQTECFHKATDEASPDDSDTSSMASNT
jgi:hypothetical protein